MTGPAGQAFTAARDPQRAQAARLNQPPKWTAAARARNRAAGAGTGRYATEVTCQNPVCRAVFCPLRSAARRKFCSRSCASSYNRRHQGGYSDSLSRSGSGDSSGPAATPR